MWRIQLSLKATEPLFVGRRDCVVWLKTMFGSKTGWQLMGSMMCWLGGERGCAMVFNISERKVIGRNRMWPQECRSVGSDLGGGVVGKIISFNLGPERGFMPVAKYAKKLGTYTIQDKYYEH
jgi:hypothetical protein